MIGKNDDAWEKLFYKYDILKMLESNSVFEISAEMIKEFREPRLMTKFDYSKNRPQIFRDNKLSILPNSRGTYNIGKFNAYKKLEYEDVKPISVAKPDWVRSFDDFPVTSESVALNLAQMTGMIDYVMGKKEDEESAVGTLTGRMKSGDFSYNIDFIGGKVAPYNFNVNNSQVEIDAGYESMTKLAVIEAKNRIPEDFMIRQLYYPYIGYDRLNTGKEVLPIYFTHADNIYGFHIFEFTDKKNYSSIKKIKQINFIIDEKLDISISKIKEISSRSPNLEEHNDTPFPQADTFTRVLDLLNYLKTEPRSKLDLSIYYGFDERQSDYYANALKYLGLVQRNNHMFELTTLGKQIASMTNSNLRNYKIIELILSDKIFNLVFCNTLNNNGVFQDEFISNTILRYASRVGNDTANRRKRSVKAWITWIFAQTS